MLLLLRQLRRSFFQPGKLRTYIAYALGEIFLIVVGILIAVQIGNWNQNRLAVIEEREILGRIMTELKTGQERVNGTGNRLVGMLEALDQVDAAFAGVPIEVNYQFLSQVTKAAQFAWGQPAIIHDTYDELQSSGKLGLIRDIDLRGSITHYYGSIRGQQNRSDLRVGDYGNLTYELIPRESDNLTFQSEISVKQGLSEEAYERIVSEVLASDLKRHALALRNRYLLIKYHWGAIRKNQDELIARIESELENN